MIRSFLKHHYDRAMRGEIKNAIANCHAVGLHSIMLHDEPGNRIRMFVTTADHMLSDANGNAQLAVHAHHCAVRLVPIFGTVFNLVYTDMRPGLNYHVCDYTSGVHGQSSLKPKGLSVDFGRVKPTRLWGSGVAMGSKELHTVNVAPGERAAWFVFEGEEDPHYVSQCYSFAPEKFDPEPLYKSMSFGMLKLCFELALRGY